MKYKKLSIALFFGIIVLLPILTFLLPKQTISEVENRELAKPPKMTVDNLLSKKFMKDTESFLTDHMVFRTQFASAKTKFELAQGKKEVNGVFIGDKMLLENIPKADKEITDVNINAINKFAEKYAGKIETNMMIVPTAIEFYPSEIPPFATTVNQTQYIQDFYSRLENVSCVDAYAPLAAAADSGYIFYRTDHHWTSYGAYIGYAAMGKTLGYKPATDDMFNIEHTTEDFLGTLYSKVLYGEKLNDKIDLYHYFSDGPVVKDVIRYTDKNTQTYPSIFFKENLQKKDKYTVFLGDNVPVVKIKTNTTNGKKIILFKDSFSHAMMQFLPLHYEEITLVDLRYLNRPLEEYVNLDEYQQALFVYNMNGIANDSSIKKIINY